MFKIEFIIIVSFLILNCNDYFESTNECLTDDNLSMANEDESSFKTGAEIRKSFFQKQLSCSTLTGEPTLAIVRVECLSAILIYTDGAYTANFKIYNIYGEKVFQSSQSFGQCGELLDPARKTTDGYISWLFWDRKDEEGRPVPGGVYTWDVELTMDSTFTVRKFEKQQGILCSNETFDCD